MGGNLSEELSLNHGDLMKKFLGLVQQSDEILKKLS
jgi:hypothetical protein